MKKRITFILLIVIITLFTCESPFNTNVTDDIFELTISHNISRVFPSAQVNLSWTEITVENFKEIIIERKTEVDNAWTMVATLTGHFQTSYIDTIFDDEDLLYRVGIVDVDENIIVAEAETMLPRTTKITVPDEIPTIQPAFKNPFVDNGDTIIVKPGHYLESLSFAGKDVLVISTGGWSNTILNPTLTTNYDEQTRVLTILSGILDGFTIEFGRPNYSKSGGGVAIAETGTVQNCYIAGNQSESDGGGVFITNAGNLYNNIITDNSANLGSGIYIQSAKGEIINNTIFDNNVLIRGDCSGLLLRNNIIYNSAPYTPDIIFIDENDQTSIVLDYSLFDYNTVIGENNISGNPNFVDNINFELDSTSPCIDAGHPDAQYNDIDGTRNDIGATGGPKKR